MKIIIVRHGDPDYAIDSLTSQGKIEAELLSHKLCKLNVAAFYVSPLGRAKDTAAYTLNKLNRTATVCEWLKEFSPQVDRPDRAHTVAWDWLPQDWTTVPAFFDKDTWFTEQAMVAGKVKEEYEYVCTELDRLLAKHGYERDGNMCRAVHANEDTIVFFCHFGLECVLLSHLLNISPMQLWHGLCAAPTSVTTLITEERRKGAAYFRMNGFGDVGHLYAGGAEPSFAARFCETYDTPGQRRD